MTGQKNRFKTTEKLWNLDDKQLKTPEHDAMVLWLMNEENLKQFILPLIKYDNRVGYSNNKNLDEGDLIQESYSIKSEVPLQSQNGFINGYADLIVNVTYDEVINSLYPSCPIDKKWINLIEDVSTLKDMEKLICLFLDCESFEIKPYCKSRCYENHSFSPSKYVDIEDYDGTLDLKSRLIDFFRNVGVSFDGIKGTHLKGWVTGEWYNCKHYDKYMRPILIEVKPKIDSFGGVLRQINSYSAFRRDCIICLFTLDSRFDSQFESQGIKVLHPPKDVTIEDMREIYGL